jgi:hypothetical protein
MVMTRSPKSKPPVTPAEAEPAPAPVSVSMPPEQSPPSEAESEPAPVAEGEPAPVAESEPAPVAEGELAQDSDDVPELPPEPDTGLAAAVEMRWVKMLTGLSGPTLCLTRNDKHPFAADEAQRLVDGNLAVFCDAPTD